MQKVKWSILICSIPERSGKLALLKSHLEKQIQGKPVELLILETERFDKGGPSVGAKRNQLKKQAQGEYINFIDDDDWVSDDYVDEILKAMNSKADVIAFDMIMTHTGREIAVKVDRSLLNANPEGKPRERMPNHLNPVKKKISDKVEFPGASFGEDTSYAIQLKSLLKSQQKINKQLYHYRFDAELSATHKYNPIHVLNGRSEGKHNPMIKMDVIIVSDGTRPELRKLTQKAINSISGPSINVIIVEKSNVKYQFADTIPQPEFNYNACLNKGALYGNSNLIAFCNNDIVFPRNFLELVEKTIKGYDVLSVKDSMGYMPKEMVSGHCFVMTREAYYKIGKLNEKYMFWCADNVTSEQIKEHGLKEIKTNIQVDHIRSASLRLLDGRKRYAFTTGSAREFEKDYNKKVLC